MPDRIDRNQAIEIVGNAKFGDAWVGPATDDEFKWAKKYRSRFTTGAHVPAQEAQAVYEAEEREARADRQHREVIQWLENRGLDCVRGLAEGLDQTRFEKVLEREFGKIRPRSVSVSPAKNRRYATDDALVAEAVAGINNNEYPNPLKAARALAPRAQGQSAEAAIDRLRRKIAQAIAVRPKPSEPHARPQTSPNISDAAWKSHAYASPRHS